MKAGRRTKSEGTRQRIKVFISERCPLVAYALEQLLNTEQGCEVCGQAHHVSTLRAELRRLKPRLLITDFDPECGKGFNLIKELREQFPDLRLLVFSRWSELIFAERLIRLGAHGYVPQSAPISVLSEAVRYVLNHEIYISDVVKESILGKMNATKRPETRARLDRLNNREIEVLCAMAQGKDMKEIAQSLNLKLKTLETYRSSIMHTLGLDGVNHLLVWSVGQAPYLLE